MIAFRHGASRTANFDHVRCWKPSSLYLLKVTRWRPAMRPLRCWRGHVRRTTCRPFRSAAILAVKLGRLRRWQNSGAVGSRRCVSSMCTSTEVLSPLGATWYRGRGSGKGIQENDDQPHAGASQEPAALRAAPRCGARTRSGSPCRSPIVNGEKRCRMHGGAVGSGAPKGGKNGNWKHGNYCGELRSALRLFRMVARIARQSRRATDTA
jgi:hypothetical protein